MMEILKHHLVILGLAITVIFANLGGSRLWDRDEPRNAGCAAEMFERGDWVVPTFNDELRTAKPVFLYWLIFSAYRVLGVTEFAARFWSAALGVGTVVVTYHIGRRLFNGQVGLWSALVLLTSLMFNVAARAATPDSALIFFTTLSLLLFVLGGFPDFPRQWPYVIGMYALMGCGVLTKGPVGFVMPMAVIGMFLLIVRLRRNVNTNNDTERIAGPVLPLWRFADFTATLLRPFRPLHFLRTLWRMRPMTALLVLAFVALPWYLAVAIRTDGQWVKSFLLVENIGRATSVMENHRGSPLYYPVALIAGFFPASIFFGVTLTHAVNAIRRQTNWKHGITFLICWVGVFLVFFSFVQTKLPSYITPTHPAMALLTGCFLYHWTSGTVRVPVWREQTVFGVLGVIGLLGIASIFFISKRFLPGEEWLWSVGLIPIIGSCTCLLFLKFGYRFRAATTFLFISMAMCVALFGLVVDRVDSFQRAHELFDVIHRKSTSPRVASYICLEPSWIFYGQTKIKRYGGGDADEVGEFVNESENNFVITTDRNVPQLSKILKEKIVILAKVPYFMRKEHLVLLGHAQADNRRHVAFDPKSVKGRR